MLVCAMLFDRTTKSLYKLKSLDVSAIQHFINVNVEYKMLCLHLPNTTYQLHPPLYFNIPRTIHDIVQIIVNIITNR